MKKYLSLVLCVFVLTATANTAQAFDKKDLAKLKKTQRIGIAKCIKCNLGGAILKSRPDRGRPEKGQPDRLT